MLNAYSNTSQTVEVNGNVVFNNNNISTGRAISHTAGTSTITLNRPGFYLVQVNADATATTTTTSPIIMQLMNNNAAVPGAEASALSIAAATPVNIGFSTIVRVKPSCCIVDNDVTLTVQNQGVAASYTNANITITKLP